MAKKPKTGDVVRITARRGYAYAQVSHIHKNFGCLLRILDGFFAPQQGIPNVGDFPEIFQTYMFYQDLLISGYSEIVCNAPLRDEFKTHPLMRDGVRNPKTGKVGVWWLWDGIKEWPIGVLPENMRGLSLRGIWNYKMLIDRIENGWRPDAEV
ncbi:hypothetical protein V5E97_06130 [Singulisphaera sp. Ch08]|uniref:Uncharacterized protein n=1 Tax=Singulisphaera sp. Ch08 TaxID=3120278 RepID=A0AAU7CLR7_9BACT